HAQHLEERFGCGPHTVSVPRIEPAEGAPASSSVPMPVSDDDFRYLVAILRLAMPYTGIILSTRESEALRNELFRYGVSQISAGSRTNPGAYADAAKVGMELQAQSTSNEQARSHADDTSGSQFQLGDHRTLQEVVAALTRQGYVPSFCTGCYRKGRVGADFMDLAKPGLIKRFCEPNALFTFLEYLEDFADESLRAEGLCAMEEIILQLPDEPTRVRTRQGLAEIGAGARDVYL
ncbi:MAG: [FeFe] hydrogenase H-cluster radical SAM maturase HydG, partial [Rectinemataceae bacterium]